MNKVFRICEEIKAGWAARDLIRLWEGIATEMRKYDPSIGDLQAVKYKVSRDLKIVAKNNCPACEFFVSCNKCEARLKWINMSTWPAEYMPPCEYPTSVYRKWRITGDVGYAEAVAAKGYQWLREIKRHGM